MKNNIYDSGESNFERTSKRRKGFPSETQVKRGFRVVHGYKELREKLGRNDLCPCGSTRRFQEVLHAPRPARRRRAGLLFSGSRERCWCLAFARRCRAAASSKKTSSS